MVLAQKQTHRSVKRLESPEINPCIYGQLTYEKEARIYNGEKTIFSINGVGKTGQLHVKE